MLGEANVNVMCSLFNQEILLLMV